MHLEMLKGLCVVESSAFIAAPLAGMTLAHAGADVIRVDLVGGGIDYGRLPLMPNGRSLYWTGLNKGKRSIAIDFRQEEGRALVRALVAAGGTGGGILLTNIGSAWLSHASLATERPDLISCTIEGNPDGTTAIDYTVNAAVGFPGMTGNGSLENPVNHVLPAWDIAAAHHAAFAITAAAYRRSLSGQGSELRVALADVAFSTLSHLGMLTEAELLDQERASDGNYLYGAFGRDFATSDGQRVFAAGISSAQWRNLIAATDAAAILAEREAAMNLDFSKESDRYAARHVIADALAPWFASRSMSEVAAALNAARVCWGPYQTVRQALRDDPRIKANPIFAPVKTRGVGEHLAAGAIVRMAGAPNIPTVPAPLLGEHTDQILSEILNLDSGSIARLHDKGLVAGADKDPFMTAARETFA